MPKARGVFLNVIDFLPVIEVGLHRLLWAAPALGKTRLVNLQRQKHAVISCESEIRAKVPSLLKGCALDIGDDEHTQFVVAADVSSENSQNATVISRTIASAFEKLELHSRKTGKSWRSCPEIRILGGFLLELGGV